MKKMPLYGKGPQDGALWQCVSRVHDPDAGRYRSVVNFLRPRPGLQLCRGLDGYLVDAQTGQSVLRPTRALRCSRRERWNAEFALIGLRNGGLDAIDDHPQPGKLA
jgi:hypothetical protein